MLFCAKRKRVSRCRKKEIEFEKLDIFKASIEILRNLPLETGVQKTSFITRFVNKVDVFNDGRVLVIVDSFGHKATALVTEESNNIVRIQPILSRHYIEFINLE